MQRAIPRGDEQTRRGGQKSKINSILSPGGQIVGAFGVQRVLKNVVFEPCWVQFLALFGVQRRFENRNAKGNPWGR